MRRSDANENTKIRNALANAQEMPRRVCPNTAVLVRAFGVSRRARRRSQSTACAVRHGQKHKQLDHVHRDVERLCKASTSRRSAETDDANRARNLTACTGRKLREGEGCERACSHCKDVDLHGGTGGHAWPRQK